MDMFVYGCPNVIRYLSLLNHSAVLYEVKSILETLGLTQKELREICILSGTDYNSQNDETKNSPNLNSTLKLYKKYYKDQKKDKKDKKDNKEDKEDADEGFYDWLNTNTTYIQDYELLIKIYDMFDLNKNHYNVKIFEAIRIANGPIMKEVIRDILKTDGFIFPINTTT
jgi:hypothetical protein